MDLIWQCPQFTCSHQLLQMFCPVKALRQANWLLAKRKYDRHFGQNMGKAEGDLIAAGQGNDIDISNQSVHICVHFEKENILAHVRLTEFRQNIATHFDNVIASRAPLLVTRQGSEALVLVAEGEYESMMETLHLLSTPANSERLRESMAQLRRGELTEKDPTL